MIKVTITVAVLLAILGAVIMGLTDLFWTPIFFFALAISIALFNASIRVGLIGLGVSAGLYVVVYFVEPRWLQVLLAEI
jgi:hypothetical protein